MAERFRPRPSGEQPDRETEKTRSSEKPEAGEDPERRKKAEELIREMVEGATELTKALGLPKEEKYKVLFWASASTGKLPPEIVEHKEKEDPTPEYIKEAYRRWRRKLN